MEYLMSRKCDLCYTIVIAAQHVISCYNRHIIMKHSSIMLLNKIMILTKGLDSFMVSLHSLMAGICLPFGLCKGTVSGLWKMVEIPSVSPQFISVEAIQKLSIDQPITKGWCQPIGGHVSYPTGRPNATRLGLCNSLQKASQHSVLSCPKHSTQTLNVFQLLNLLTWYWS